MIVILFYSKLSCIPSVFVIKTVISINSAVFIILLLSRFLFPLALKYELFSRLMKTVFCCCAKMIKVEQYSFLEKMLIEI